MAIAFPSTMRSIDEAYRAIRFSGYDDMMEIRFSVDFAALDVLAGHLHSSDKAYLSAFDEMRALIQVVAARTYKKSKSSLNRLAYKAFQVAIFRLGSKRKFFVHKTMFSSIVKKYLPLN